MSKPNKTKLCIFNNIYEFAVEDLALKTAFYYLECNTINTENKEECNIIKNNIESMQSFKKQLEYSYYKCRYGSSKE